MTKINLPDDFNRFEDIDDQINETKVTGFKYKNFVTFAIYQRPKDASIKFKIFNTPLYERMEYDDQRTYTRYIRLNNESDKIGKVQIDKILDLCEYLYNKYKEN